MTTPRRSKAMPTDGPTAKFLYTILKQLDLKSIDWNLVASQLEISNGHAARMRYSRFRQQMEGIVSTPRSARPKKTAGKPKATGKASTGEETVPRQPQPVVKQDPHTPGRDADFFIKADPYAHSCLNLADIPLYSSQNQTHPGPSNEPSTTAGPATSIDPDRFSMFGYAPSCRDPTVAFDHAGTQHVWTLVKSESDIKDEIFIKTEPSKEHYSGVAEDIPGLQEMAAESRVSKVEGERI